MHIARTHTDQGKNTCVARLGSIVAEIRREKEKQKLNGQNTDVETPSFAVDKTTVRCSWSDEGRQPTAKRSKLNLSFEDGDSDSDSQTRFVQTSFLVLVIKYMYYVLCCLVILTV